MAVDVWIPPLGLGLRHALDPVDAALELEMAERSLPDDAERDLAEAGQLRRLEVERLELPAHLLGEPAIHLEEVAGEQRGLVAPRCHPDLDDQGRMVRAGAAIVEQVAELVTLLLLPRLQPVELGLGIGTHLGIGLAGAESLGLRDLPAQLQVSAVGNRDLRQRTALPGQGRDPVRVGRDLGVEQGALDLQESLVVGLELLEHLSILRADSQSPERKTTTNNTNSHESDHRIASRAPGSCRMVYRRPA